MKYQILLTVRAKDGSRAVSADLLPPVVALEADTMLGLLIAMQNMVSDPSAIVTILELDDIYALAEKVELDVENNKYKWTIEK